MEKKVDLGKLFQEKRYSEIIFIIENKIQENQKNSGLINLVGVCRLLKVDKAGKDDLTKAIEDFRRAYLKEKRTINSLEAFRNFIHTSVDLYDFENSPDNHSKVLKNFNEAIDYFKEDEDYFGNDPLLLLAIIRIYNRLIDLDNVRYYLDILDKKKYHTPFNIRLLIFSNCSIKKWSQEKFLEYGKILNDILPEYPNDKLIPIIKNKYKNKKVKIGFFSSDIRKSHSVTFFLKTVLSKYNKNKFEIYLYLNHKKINDDETTKLFKKMVDECHYTANLDNIAAINLIRKHSLDIFVDLMGVTSGSRLEIVKNRVSPVQISWCGYCNTTGLNEMDYLLADKNLIYENELNLYKEKIIFLPKIWNAHAGYTNQREFNETPALKKGYITFGSFNNFTKINDNVIKTWSEILRKTRNSKLILKSSSPRVNDILAKKFQKENIFDRVEIKQHIKKFEDHINLYKEIDLALDTFPYNGVTTSFEAIWMGVPVLTMQGYNFNSRCGESINKNLGLINLIAKDEKDYIFKAKKLAEDQESLKEIRTKVYDEAINSPLFDSKKFNNDFYNLLETLKVRKNG